MTGTGKAARDFPSVVTRHSAALLLTSCLDVFLPQNAQVLGARMTVLSLLLLAGCSTSSRQGVTPLGDEKHPQFTPMSSLTPASPTFSPLPPPPTPPPTTPIPTPARPATPAASPQVSAKSLNETWIPLQRWSRNNGLAVPDRLQTTSVPTYSLHSSNGVFLFRTGSQIAQWDGLELRLGFAPQLIDGQPYLHRLDLHKTLQPLLSGSRVLSSSHRPVIVIDAGHGGENAGTKSVLGEHYEKEFTLDWAVRLQTLLSNDDREVFLTRTDDTDLALSTRVAFAAQHRADLFVSLHFNSAAPNQTEAGLETYCLTPVGMPSSLTRGFADEIEQTFPNNTFDAQNLQLALQVHRALLQVNGCHDRGVRRARFLTVLRGQQRPAILVEAGYLSNPEEARLIGTPAYRQKLAEAVAHGIIEALALEVSKPEARDTGTETTRKQVEDSHWPQAQELSPANAARPVQTPNQESN